MTITNFQYVGYLSDVLGIYNDIDTLTARYHAAKANFDGAKSAMKEYQSTFSFKNCILGWTLIFAGLMLTFPLLFIPGVKFGVWITFCALISCVIILLSKIIYQTKVLPLHRANLNIEIEKARRAYNASYESLVTHRHNLNEMREGIEEPCSYPLSLYIMCEAAKEGQCSNIPQGIRYFTNRYKTLEKANDEAFTALKANIDREQEKAKERQGFLDNLDETARTLFE